MYRKEIGVFVGPTGERFKLETVSDGNSNLLGLDATRESDGKHGTFIRLKGTNNGKLAADLPGVDGDAFAKDPVTGTITNG